MLKPKSPQLIREKKKQKTENRYTAQVKGVRDGSPSIDLT